MAGYAEATRASAVSSPTSSPPQSPRLFKAHSLPSLLRLPPAFNLKPKPNSQDQKRSRKNSIPLNAHACHPDQRLTTAHLPTYTGEETGKISSPPLSPHRIGSSISPPAADLRSNARGRCACVGGRDLAGLEPARGMSCFAHRRCSDAARRQDGLLVFVFFLSIPIRSTSNNSGDSNLSSSDLL